MTSAESQQDSAVQRQLVGRLPAHMIARDDETGGELQALLAAVGAELDLLEGDVRRLYDAWFVETCDEWILPYLADLIGLDDLPPLLGPGTSRRALVANTVGYRRRKGCASVLVDLTTDLTRWSTRGIQFFALTATTANINDVHLDRPAVVSVRDTDGLRRAALSKSSATTLTDGLDRLAHTAEVRQIATGRGRYNVNAIGIFVYPMQTFEIGGDENWSQARPAGEGFTFDPLGWSTPLFVPDSDGVVNAAESARSPEDGLPMPLRPHRLHSMLMQAREDPSRSLPLGIRVHQGNQSIKLSAAAIRVCGLEDLSSDPPELVEAMVDPVAGRFTLYRNGATPIPGATATVRYAYGALASLGAGPYDRSSAHELALASDPFPGDPAVTGQTSVRAMPSAEGNEPGPGDPAEVLTLDDAFTHAAHTLTGTHVVSIVDNADHLLGQRALIAPSSRLVIVAATWPTSIDAFGNPQRHNGIYVPNRLRPHLIGDLVISGRPGSSAMLDGILLEGDLVVDAGNLGSLTLCQVTVTGTVRVIRGEDGSNADLQVRITRSVVGGLDLATTVSSLSVTDSVIDSGLTTSAAQPGTPVVAPAIRAEGSHAVCDGITVRGAVRVRRLDASSSIFDGNVAVVDHQIGCLRYSYAVPGSVTPRRFHCAPPETQPDAAPVYAAQQPGAPDYLALSTRCPDVIRRGGEDTTEMGVQSHLRRPLRLTAAARQLSTYRPAGRALRIFGS